MNNDETVESGSPKPKYVRFGDEWGKEVMKCPKGMIVDMLREQLVRKPESAAAVDGKAPLLGEWYDIKTVTPPSYIEALVWRGESVEEGFCVIAEYYDGEFHPGPGYIHPEWILDDVTHWWWCPGMPGSICYPVTKNSQAETPGQFAGPAALPQTRKTDNEQ